MLGILRVAILLGLGQFTALGQTQMYQYNRDGTAIQINKAGTVNISLANEKKTVPVVPRKREPVPPIVAAEQMWKTILRLAKLSDSASDAQVLKALPRFAQPDEEDREAIAEEFREFIPKLGRLDRFPEVLGWQPVNTVSLDSRGTQRITFMGMLAPSPFAFDPFGNLLPAPAVQLVIDIDGEGVPRGFNVRGYSPYQ
jgi:hypothetical protein